MIHKHFSSIQEKVKILLKLIRDVKKYIYEKNVFGDVCIFKKRQFH